MEDRCEYFEQAVADSRQGVVLLLGLGGGASQLLTVKYQLPMKCHTETRNWTDFLERPRHRKMDMRFGT
jgi:hypothetical protein